jgi:hypothetical protein
MKKEYTDGKPEPTRQPTMEKDGFCQEPMYKDTDWYYGPTPAFIIRKQRNRRDENTR